jgi:predicted NodU family carbamoyl transferase
LLYKSTLIDLLGPARAPNEPLEQKHKDLARSIQVTYEKAFFALLHALHKQHPCCNLALAGGCAMNSVANGKVYRRTPFTQMYLPAAAGDAGGAIGAAVYVWSELAPGTKLEIKKERVKTAGASTTETKKPKGEEQTQDTEQGTEDREQKTEVGCQRSEDGEPVGAIDSNRLVEGDRTDTAQPQDTSADALVKSAMGAPHSENLSTPLGVSLRPLNSAYLGPQSTDQEVHALIDWRRKEIALAECVTSFVGIEEELVKRTAQAIADGKVVGWYQGRMEWGPRALGNRSILADPRRADMKDILNAKIKRRESFRPFAPSILREAVSDWFETDDDVPFMMEVFQIRAQKRSFIPAVTHVDGSGRLQTVHKETNLRYYRLIEQFRELTGIPMVLNTSFNENEPVVCYPEEALDCFLRTKMDLLVLGNFWVERKNSESGNAEIQKEDERQVISTK